MHIQAINPLARLSQPEPAGLPVGKAKQDAEAKLKESCRQFEAVLWRSVLEKSNSSQSGSEASPGGDKTGTYQYFINDTLANSVSGLPSSFSSVLFAALAPHLPQEPKSSDHS